MPKLKYFVFHYINSSNNPSVIKQPVFFSRYWNASVLNIAFIVPESYLNDLIEVTTNHQNFLLSLIIYSNNFYTLHIYLSYSELYFDFPNSSCVLCLLSIQYRCQELSPLIEIFTNIFPFGFYIYKFSLCLIPTSLAFCTYYQNDFISIICNWPHINNLLFIFILCLS